MSDDKIIDFQTAKEPHMHARRDKKVDEIRQAFESYLNESGLSDGKDSRQQRRKKQRDADKKKKR